jgi:hypothetical protein
VVEAAATEAAGPARRRQEVAGPVAEVDVLPQPLAHSRLIAVSHGRRSAPAEAQAGRPRDRVSCLTRDRRGRAAWDDPAEMSALAPARRVDPGQVTAPESATDPVLEVDRALEIALELATDRALAIDPEVGTVQAYRIGLVVPTDLEFPIDLALGVPIDLEFPIDQALGGLTDLEFPIDQALADPTDLEFPIALALDVRTGLVFPVALELADPTDLEFPTDLELAAPTDLLGIDPEAVIDLALADPIDPASATRRSLPSPFDRVHRAGSGAAAAGMAGTTPGTVAGIADVGP